ncbi:MAG: hypothetical protein AAF549_09345 [Pseudomonadota bacterium]
MNYKAGLMAIVIMVFLGIFPQQSVAKIFTGKSFLIWEQKNQSFYIHTSIGMAALVVGQTSKKQAKCIDEWYFKDEESGIDFILSNMRKYPEYHPRGIILAVMEKKCGKFVYTE